MARTRAMTRAPVAPPSRWNRRAPTRSMPGPPRDFPWGPEPSESGRGSKSPSSSSLVDRAYLHQRPAGRRVSGTAVGGTAVPHEWDYWLAVLTRFVTIRTVRAHDRGP